MTSSSQTLRPKIRGRRRRPPQKNMHNRRTRLRPMRSNQNLAENDGVSRRYSKKLFLANIKRPPTLNWRSGVRAEGPAGLRRVSKAHHPLLAANSRVEALAL